MTAMAFQKMSDRVQDQNQRLREALAAKNAFIALQKELDIAARVQLSLLPDTMPPSDTVRMAGTMKPAKEVGGDFYDFSPHRPAPDRDNGRRRVRQGGVRPPCSWVMARTLMRAAAQHMDAPGRVLANVNDLLEQNNAEELFVTSSTACWTSAPETSPTPTAATTRRSSSMDATPAAGDDRGRCARHVRRPRLRRQVRGSGTRRADDPVQRRRDRGVRCPFRGIRRSAPA